MDREKQFTQGHLYVWNRIYHGSHDLDFCRDHSRHRRCLLENAHRRHVIGEPDVKMSLPLMPATDRSALHKL